MSTQQVELSVKRMTRLDGNGTLKAYCDVAIAESFVVKSFKVIDGKNGLFVSMPREQGKNGQWYDTVAPLTKQVREQLSQIVLEAYSSDKPYGEQPA